MTEAPGSNPLQIGFLLYPRVTQLDLTGPWEVFHRLSSSKLHLVWKNLEPVFSDSGLAILPTTTIADCPPLDVICVPGGPGQVDLMDDETVLEFLRGQGARARWITSVCTGSLLVGAAGLLNGYKSACHWMSREQLRLLGAEPVHERIVVDRNRMSGGGVTAGIDFALALAATLRGETEARAIQLQIEYNPAPPFLAGSPESAGTEVVELVRERAKPLLESRLAATRKARVRLKLD